jgi:hypothetical protein
LVDDSSSNSFSAKLGEATARALLCQCDNIGNSVFDYAADAGNVNMLEYLVRKGLSPYRLNSQHRNALYWATRNRMTGAVRFLCKLGCDSATTDKYGVSPMMIATAYRDLELLDAIRQRSFIHKDESFLQVHQISKYVHDNSEIPSHHTLARDISIVTVISAIHDDSFSFKNRPSLAVTDVASATTSAASTAAPSRDITRSASDGNYAPCSLPTVSSLGMESAMSSSPIDTPITSSLRESPLATTTFSHDQQQATTSLNTEPQIEIDIETIIHPRLYRMLYGTKRSYAIGRNQPTRLVYLVFFAIVKLTIHLSSVIIPFWIWLIVVAILFIVYR